MKLAYGLLLASCLLMKVGCYPHFEHKYEKTPLGDSIDKATLKVLHEAYKSSDDKNVVTSPLGILLLLSMFSNGAGHDSRQEISALLGGGEFKEITQSYSGLSHELANMDPSYLTLDNKIYVDNHYELNDTFSSVLRNYYQSEVEQLEFAKPEAAAATINEWADEKTHGHIKEPVSASDLSSDTAAALFNVIFFKGHWQVPFNANMTKDKDFHVDKATTVKKPTMHLLQPFFYTASEALDAQMIELPYEESGFRMVVVLPNEVDGLPDVLKKASQKGLLEEVFNLRPSVIDIILNIPKFEVKSRLDLNVILPKVGVSKMFSESATGIVKHEAVVVSKAFQEAFVKVDEEGATAGAVTEKRTHALSMPMDFIVDHPFLYLILNKDKVLFAGTYTG